MNRYIDSLYIAFNIYYKKIHSCVYMYNLHNKLYKIEKDNNKYLHEIISAFDNDYSFDNYCCSCLNPKMNDLFIRLNCGHQMHYYCYETFIKLKYTLCPFCKSEHDHVNREYKSNNVDTDNKNYDYSYKINELYYN